MFCVPGAQNWARCMCVFCVKSNILTTYGDLTGLSGRRPLRDHQIKRRGGGGRLTSEVPSEPNVP